MNSRKIFKRGLRVKLAAFAAIVAAGFGCRSTRAGVVYAWGINDAGELGNGTYDPSPAYGYESSPTAVLNLSNGVTAIAAGAATSFALAYGAAYAWGTDSSGQLGYPYNSTSSSPYSLTPVAITGLTSGVTAVAAGDYHTLVLRDGGVYACGDNGEFEISNGTTTTPISGLSTGVTAIGAGDYYSLAVKSGAVYAWGANWHGQLGDGTTSSFPTFTPTPVTGLSSGVTAISAGGSVIGLTGGNPDGTYYSSSLALKNGGVYAWGYNRFGQLGNGTTTDSLVPMAVTGLSTGVTAIAAGFQDSLAVKNGSVYAWGANYYGQLGDGTTNEESTPELIDPTDLNNIVAVTATTQSCFALSADGSIWDWGDNTYGELGLGYATTTDFLTPQHLLPPSGYRFTSVSGQGDGFSVLATLAPIPEPTSLSLLSIGSIALLGRRRDRV